MSVVLLLVALALTGVAYFLLDSKDPQERRSFSGSEIGALVATLVGVVLVSKYGPVKDRMPLDIGLALGVIATLVSAFLGGKIAPIGVAVAATIGVHFAGADLEPAQWAVLVGAAIGALATRRPSASTTAFAVALCVAGDYLGVLHANTPTMAFLGGLVGLAGLVGSIVANALPKPTNWFRPIVIGLVILLGAFLVIRTLGETRLIIVAAIGSATGIILTYFLPDEEKDPTRIAIAAIISVSVATIAFGLGKATGMSLALAAMALVAVGSGNRLGALAASPLLGLVLYRIFREVDPYSTKALDIGQHYALLGVLLGAVIPLIPGVWNLQNRLRREVGSFLWVVIILSTPTFIAIMLGDKGSIGFVGGLGLAGICQALRHERDLLPLGVAPGLAAVTILCIDWFEDWTDLARDEKVKFFLYAGIGLIIAAAILAAISREKKTEVTA